MGQQVEHPGGEGGETLEPLPGGAGVHQVSGQGQEVSTKCQGQEVVHQVPGTGGVHHVPGQGQEVSTKCQRQGQEVSTKCQGRDRRYLRSCSRRIMVLMVGCWLFSSNHRLCLT